MKLEQPTGHVVSPRLWGKGTPVVVRPFGYDMPGKVVAPIFDEHNGGLKVLVETEKGARAFRDRKVRYDGKVK